MALGEVKEQKKMGVFFCTLLVTVVVREIKSGECQNQWIVLVWDQFSSSWDEIKWPMWGWLVKCEKI